jgi:uncharacterized protein YgiB involved in biofilm formation
MKTISVLLVMLMLSGCAASFHPQDGTKYRTMAECQADNAQSPEMCEVRETAVNGNAIFAGLWLALWTAFVVVIAVGHR